MTRTGEAGFTLLEVVVALVLLSVAVVATLQLFGGGLRLASASGDHVAATLFASAKLSELSRGPWEEGETDGTEGPYSWTRRVTLDPSLLPVKPGPSDRTAIRMARLSVEVRWGQNHRVEVVTLRTWGVPP